MPASFRDRLVFAWALLVAVTLVSIEIGVSGVTFGLGHRAIAAVAVLAIAFFKVGVVMFQFMEVRAAPLVLRVACAGWIVAALAGLVATYAGVLG